jgi:predicted alpha/beta-fold hydrolase
MPIDIHGHYWTIAPWLFHVLRPEKEPPSTPFSASIEDPAFGAMTLHGKLRERPGETSLLVIVHGLGGTNESHYMIQAAAAAERAGAPHLRLNLRGAGGTGIDFYHAGLFADLHAAVTSPALARYERIYVLGYSLGGHIALRYAAAPASMRDPRLRAVAAVCPPVDLDRTAAAIDRPERWVYRRHLLTGLKQMYSGVARRRPAPLTAEEARSISSVRAWDHRIVAPRFGYKSAEHYYAEESAAPRLGDISVPSLLIAAEADPMVPADTVRPGLRNASSRLDVRWLASGGHVGFPRSLDLGLGLSAQGNAIGLEAQVIGWLLQR